MGSVAADANGGSHGTEALYREHGAAVASLCRSLLRDRAEVEDATQQVFLSAHRALLNGAAPREPLAWLLAVARNECYARFRQRAVAPIPSGDAPEGVAADASVHAMRAGEIGNVWDEVGRMPAPQREAFLLREIRGLSYGQLADELSLSRPSVRSLLLRARARLRHRLGNVAAGVGGAPWVQALLRLFAGGDGASPIPAAKAAAVGLGALALVGGGGMVAHQALRTTDRPAGHRQAAGPTHRAPASTPAPAAPSRTPLVFAGRSSVGTDRPSGQGEHSTRSGSGDSASSHESGDGATSSGDRSDDAPAVTKESTDSHDGGGSTSLASGSDDGSSTTGSTSGSDGGSTAASTSGSYGGSTTGTTSGSDDGSGSSTTSGSSGSDGGTGSGGD